MARHLMPGEFDVFFALPRGSTSWRAQKKTIVWQVPPDGSP